MNKGVLSPFPYYGGKAEMALDIAEMLDYNATCYIEPFGGSAKVLLNKPRHGVEIYNDSGLGVSAFMHLMSQEGTARELISRIYKTDNSREEFKRALEYKNIFDVDISRQLKKGFESELKGLLVKYGFLSPRSGYSKFREVLRDYESVLRVILPQCTKEEIGRLMYALDEYEKSITSDNSIKKGFDLPEEWRGVHTTNYLTDYDLAVATYVVFAQSRDGMGKYWSTVKYGGSYEKYIKQMDRLYDIAERLNGVVVHGAVDALAFIKYSGYLNNEEAIIYLDPPYLSVDEEKDLGRAYKESYKKSDHIIMLEAIQDAKAKILLSNYDAPVFDEYLTPDKGWKRYEHKTTTVLRRKGERDSVEVIWYNY